jgi:hypothetical protein
LQKEVRRRLVLVKKMVSALFDDDEVRRREEQIDADLTAARGYEFQGLKRPAKLQLVRQGIMKKEDSTNGEYVRGRYDKIL